MKDISWNRSTNPIVSVIKNFKEFFKQQTNASDEEIALKVKQLVNGLSSGEEPQATVRLLLQKEVLERLPDIATYPKTGKIKYDGDGNAIRIFPDGTYEELKEGQVE